MSSAPSAHEIARDARWLAQALDANGAVVRLIEMTPDAYRSASFLDDRMFQEPVVSQALPFAEVAAAMPGDARSDARWIFHIGHVGSTLISRLLGELDGVLAIREPCILRDVGAMPAGKREALAPAIQKLFSRTFAVDEVALVKATSFVSEIAAELVPPGGRALLLYTDPRTYVASILAGPNSLKELEALADTRARRMTDRVHGMPPGNGTAHLAAIAWACEMSALEAAADAMADRQILWANFDRLLANMETGVGELATFFGFEAPANRVRDVVRGPLMARYSKAMEYEYSPALRRELIEQEIRLQGAAIDDAIAALGEAAANAPLLVRALARP